MGFSSCGAWAWLLWGMRNPPRTGTVTVSQPLDHQGSRFLCWFIQLTTVSWAFPLLVMVMGSGNRVETKVVMGKVETERGLTWFIHLVDGPRLALCKQCGFLSHRPSSFAHKLRRQHQKVWWVFSQSAKAFDLRFPPSSLTQGLRMWSLESKSVQS